MNWNLNGTTLKPKTNLRRKAFGNRRLSSVQERDQRTGSFQPTPIHTNMKTAKPPRPMTAEAIEQSAQDDRDAQPLTAADLKRMKRTPQAKIIRRALELSQEEFAARFHIPLGTLRDWEQGRAEPDQPTRAYLTVIARDPVHVNRALNPKST